MTPAEALAIQTDPKAYGKALKANPAMRRKAKGHKWDRLGYVQNKNTSRIDLIARAVRNRKP